MTSITIETLESLIRSQAAGRDADARVVLMRLGHEIKNRMVRKSDLSLDFIEASVRSLVKLKGSGNAALRMECLCDSGEYLFANQRTSAALVAGAACESLARQVNDLEFASKSQILQSMANAELGNAADAVVQCSQAFETSLRIGNVKRQLSALINLGIALHYAGVDREAVACYDRVLAIIRDSREALETERKGYATEQFELSALTNKAQSYFALGDFSQSYKAIRTCLDRTLEPTDATQCERRTIREFTFVQAALALGKLSEAREHTHLCYQYGRRANDRATLPSEIAGALCELHGGDPQKGIRSLESLLDRALTAANTYTVLAALVRGYEQIGRPEDALTSLHGLIDHMRAQRNADVGALLAIDPTIRDTFLASPAPDALITREAVLRAKVAERRLASERHEMFERLAVAADLKEDASGRHGYRVGRLAALTAQRLRWDATAIFGIEVAARLHDIGKMAIPDRVLSNSQSLPDADRRLVTAHAVIGSELLAKAQSPELATAEQIAHFHHEWWDGTGYPLRLSGKRIPIHARIVALADVFDALTHGRPYAPAWSIDRALEEIRNRRGTQFDPELTDLFLALIDDLRRKHEDLDAFLAEASRNSPFLQAREKIRAMLESGQQPKNIQAATTDTVH